MTTEQIQPSTASEFAKGWNYNFTDEDDAKRFVKYVRRLLAGSTLAGIAVGFVAGNTLARDGEAQDNAQDLATAAAYENCANFIADALRPEDTKMLVRMSELSSDLKIDCGLDTLQRSLNNDIGIDNETTGASIVSIDAWAEMPKVEHLEGMATELRHKAGYDHFDVATETGMGVVVGGMMGATFAAWSVSLSVRRRSEVSRSAQSTQRIIGTGCE